MNSRIAAARRENELPDPPDNLEFLALTDDAQASFTKRFEVGIALTEARDTVAYRKAQAAWANWVHRCRQNRERERLEARKERAQRDAILEQNRRRVR